jgi:arsenite transporter
MTAAPQADIQPANLPPNKEQSEGADTASPSSYDIEGRAGSCQGNDPHESKVSAFKSLGLLERFLVIWILLAMTVGILLGNFVPNVSPVLQKGQFVGVSVPIGKKRSTQIVKIRCLCTSIISRGVTRYDVPNLVQGQIRDTSSCLPKA